MSPQPLFEAPFLIQLHVYAALAAALLGAVILFRRKGTPRHRLAGKVWVALMVVVSLSSFGIHEINLWGRWSPIHILSIVTLVSLAAGIWLARRRQVAGHRFTMQATYVGALLVAGLFTFLPGRLMHTVLFGSSDVSAWLLALPTGLLAQM